MMKQKLAAVMAVLGMSLFSCAQHENITSVDVDEFSRAVSGGHVQMLDVRTADEFQEGHIAGAVNVDVLRKDFKSRAAAVLDRTKPVYVYCRSGRRSLRAASTLARKGFRVVNLKGGIIAWKEAGGQTSTQPSPMEKER